MPSPLAHSAMGYFIYRLSQPPGDPSRLDGRKLRISPALVLLVGFSLLPDVDAVFGILFNDMLRFHNNGTHSLVVALALALIVGGVAAWRNRRVFLVWFGLTLSTYSLHVLMDAVTLDSRGVMLLWPLSLERFQPALKLFYGVQWSEGLFSAYHLITLASELIFVAVLLLAQYFIDHYRRIRWVGRTSDSSGTPGQQHTYNEDEWA